MLKLCLHCDMVTVVLHTMFLKQSECITSVFVIL